MQRKINFKIFSIILLMVASMTLSCLAQSQFEGKVVMNVKAGDKDTDMNMFVKGNKTLIQVNNEQKANLIMDSKAKTMTILMPEQKMYMEIDMNTMKGISDKIKKNDESESNEKTNSKFDKTGETKKINGYECEKWVYTDDNGDKTEAWMTKELGNFMGFSNPMSNDESSSWQKEIEGKGYFPMLAVHYVDGKVESSMEVKSVEKKSLDESMFEVPAGFNKLSMPMMNRGQH
jgi:hypothetical protein